MNKGNKAPSPNPLPKGEGFRKQRGFSSGRVAAFGAVGLALVVSFAMCTESEAAKGGGTTRQVGLASIQYMTDRSYPNVHREWDEDVGGTTFGATGVKLNSLQLTGPANAIDTLAPAPGTSETFTIPVHAQADLLYGAGQVFHLDTIADYTYKQTNNSSAALGPMDFELVSLDMAGFDPVLGLVKLRKSTLQGTLSSGRIEAELDTDSGGAYYEVTSFFDVFFDISINNGPFVRADSAMRIWLTPEPGTMVMAGLGAIGCVIMVRRRKKR